MIATSEDVTRHFEKILFALEQREPVMLLHHGKVAGTIMPVTQPSALRVEEHPFFGMLRDDARSVEDIMDDVRGGRVAELNI